MSKFLLPGKLQRSSAVEPFPPGTLMLFQQTAAPIGWTKETTHNNKALRVVTGTAGSGGATAFNSVFGSGKVTGNKTLSIAQLAVHSHLQAADTIYSAAGGTGGIDVSTSTTTHIQRSTLNAGSGSSHNHTLSLDLQFVDLIIAKKD